MAKIQFSDSTNKTGLVELLGRATGTQDATTSTYPLKQKTVDINDALDWFLMLARKASPGIKIDDTNFTGEPIYVQNLSSSTNQYTFTVDASSAQISGIERVEIETATGKTKRLQKMDSHVVGLDSEVGETFAQQAVDTGEPTSYRISGKYIVLDKKPNYTTTSGTGLRMYHDRCAYYFTSTDTAVFPGINNLFHAYLWLRPAYMWVLLKKGKAAAAGLKEELEKMEAFINVFFSTVNNKDTTKINGENKMKARKQNNR
jgi:hypothetical protein